MTARYLPVADWMKSVISMTLGMRVQTDETALLSL